MPRSAAVGFAFGKTVGTGAAHSKIGMALVELRSLHPEDEWEQVIPHPKGSPVASLETRPSKSDPTGVSYSVKWRQDGRVKGETFEIGRASCRG